MDEPTPANEEAAPRDDAVIGRAFRRSLALLLLVGAVVAGISFIVEPNKPRFAFVHNKGPSGKKFLPKTMGGGWVFFDFDNDGASALLFINPPWWPGHIPEGKPPTTMALSHNAGHGHFTDVTAGSGLDL